MPPESLPWDRKDFVFKDRKHDRITSGDALFSAAFGGGDGNSTPRWRDPYHFPRASPRRPPPSYHRQNGSYYQLNDESNGHGCTPSRSDDGFRSSNGRYNGGRSSSRENRGSFRRSPYYDGYVPSHATSQRSVAVPIISPPPPPPLKDLQDKNSGAADDQRSDRDSDRDHSLCSLGWKHLKWSRQGLISSSKVVRSEVEESGNGSLDVSVPNLGKETPVRSLVSSPAPLDDEVPKKKPRLTWGQGLAKYEKQMVEVSADSGKDQVSEPSPKVLGVAGSMSPVTPCSAACPSPGAVDRPFSKTINVDNDTSHHSETSVSGLQNCTEELRVKLDHLPPISKLTSLLNDLLQPEDACTGDSISTTNTAINKLISFKAEISKELEKTECEIDLLENEMKSLKNAGKNDPIQISLALQADITLVPLSESASLSSKMSLDSTREIYSTRTAAGEPLMPICSSGEHALEMRHTNNDIPHTASANDGESTPSGNEESMSLDLRENEVAGNGSGNANHVVGESSGANADLDMSSHEKRENKFIALILASNKDAAKRASQIFYKALATGKQQFDIWGSDRMLLCRKNDVHVREQLTLQKHQLKFKERVLTLKFKVFRHLWKEDLQLLSVKKQRPKLQKRIELSSLSSQRSTQKHRSSVRSRFTLSAGNLTLVPTADIVDFTSKLLSNSQIKLYRKDLKMPLLILDEKDRRYSRFITNNNLIEDPPSFEKESSMINPWTQEEKGVFMEMLATFGKDFARISSFLSHKTTADCIEFYYKNHKSESFRDVKKQLDLRKQWRCLSANTSYLVTSGKKWNREANVALPDMRGTVPVAVANNNGTSRNQQKYAGRFVVPSHHSLTVLNGRYSSVKRASSIEISGNEKETTGTDALADMHGALSSEAVSSCVTSSVSPPEKMIFVRMARPLTPKVTQTIEDTCSDEGCGELGSVDWTDEEKSMFIRALSLYGKDFARISECVGTKSRDQCKIFFSKGRKCLSLDQIHPGAGSGSTPISGAIVGRSDIDDACAAEMDSAICSSQSCSRMDVDFTQSVANTCVEGSVHIGNTSLQNEINRSSEKYDVGGSHQEEVDGKVDGLESVLRVEKLETEKESVQPRVVKGMGDAALKHSGLVPRNDGVESTMDRELGEVVVGGELGRVDNDISVSLTEPSTASCIEGEPLKPEIAADVQQGGIPEGKSPAVGVKSEVEIERVSMVSETGSGERKRKIDTDKINGVTFSLAAESTGKESDSDKAPRMNACPKRVFSFSSHQEPLPVELLSCLLMKHQMSPKQDHAYLPLSTVLADPSSICSEGSFRVPSQSTINFNDHPHKLHQGSATKDFYQQCPSRINLNQMDQSSHVLSGYPVQVMNQLESKEETDVINEKPALCESHYMGNLGSQLNPYFIPDVHNEKGGVSVASNSRSGMLFFPRKEDTSDSQLRSCSMNSCQETEEQSTYQTGDVRLFGQFLTNPSSQRKSNPSSQETDSQPLSPKQKKTAIAKMSTSRTDSSSSIFPPRSECIGQSSLEEDPLRSYGYWDGHRTQTGFSSLPEPAIMLAAYQDPVAGTPFLSAKDSGVSSNGAAVNYQQAYVQPLSATGKRLDSFPELQKRKGFELASGFQPGRRTAMARLGVNMAGGTRGILIGGSGVSDPVLKMAKLYTREMETRSRDLNGR